jgi:hypothetical protein
VWSCKPSALSSVAAARTYARLIEPTTDSQTGCLLRLDAKALHRWRSSRRLAASASRRAVVSQVPLPDCSRQTEQPPRRSQRSLRPPTTTNPGGGRAMKSLPSGAFQRVVHKHSPIIVHAQ